MQGAKAERPGQPSFFLRYYADHFLFAESSDKCRTPGCGVFGRMPYCIRALEMVVVAPPHPSLPPPKIYLGCHLCKLFTAWVFNEPVPLSRYYPPYLRRR